MLAVDTAVHWQIIMNVKGGLSQVASVYRCCQPLKNHLASIVYDNIAAVIIFINYSFCYAFHIIYRQ